MISGSWRRSWCVFAVAAALVIGGAASASATLLTGPFIPLEPATGGVATNGTTFTIGGQVYNVPAELQPTVPFTFRLTPSGRVLYSHRLAQAGDPCAPGPPRTVLFFHRLPASGPTLIPIVANPPLCIPNGVAWEDFYDRPAVSPQQIAAVAEVRAPDGFQRIRWVDLVGGTIGGQAIAYTFDIERPSLRVAPSGTTAFVKHGLQTPIGNSDWTMVDLCPGTLGVRIPFNDAPLGATAAAAVVQLPGGSYVARISDPGLPGGTLDLAVSDCLDPAADLSLAMTDSPDPVTPGGALTYTLTVNNGGPSAATGVTLTDTLPAGTTFSAGSSSPGCTAVGSTVTCAVGSLANGATDVRTVVVTVGAAATGSLTNTAIAAASQFDPATANNSASAVTAIVSPADLGLSMADAPDPVIAGSPLVYTLAVVNNGPLAAAGVTLIHTLPVGVTFVSAPSCAFTLANRRVTCTLGTLANGASASRTVNVTVDPQTRGSLVSPSTVSSSVLDPNPANNSASATTTVGALAAVALVKNDRPDPVPAGGVLVYEIDVRNTGPSSATAVTVADALPPGVTPLEGGGSPIVCALDPVDPGGTHRATLLTRVDPGLAPGTVLPNNATVTAAEPDPNPADNTASASTTVIAPVPPPTEPFARIADTRTPIPDGAGNFTDFTVPAASGEFTGFMGLGTAGQEGAYRSVGGVLVLAADQDTPIPQGLGRFTFFDTISPLSMSGPHLVVSAFGIVLPGNFNQHGLYATDPCALRMAVNQSTPSGNANTGSTGGFDFGFDGPVLRSGRVAFWAGGVISGVLMVKDGATLTTIADRNTPIPNGVGNFRSLGRPGYDGAIVAFAGGSDAPSQAGVYASFGGSLMRIADRTTPVPGGPGTFPGFGGNVVLDGTQVAFDSAGWIYLYDHAQGSIRAIADGNTPIPGTSATFAFLGDSFSLSNGRVAFTGQGPGPAFEGRGLYLYEAGTIRPVILVGQPLDGLTLASIPEIGPEALSGSRLAFKAFVTDGAGLLVRGVYVADVGAPVGTTPSVSFQNAASTVGESSPTASVAVTLTVPGPATTLDATVAFASANGSATAGSDYTAVSGLLTFPAGSTTGATRTIVVPILPDVLDEVNETFTLALSAPVGAVLGGTAVHTVTIVDDDTGTVPLVELSHGSRLLADLRSGAGATPSPDFYVVGQPPFSSIEIALDAASGDLGSAGPRLERLAADLSTVVQSSVPIGVGHGRSLRYENTAAAPAVSYVRVASDGCQTDCDAADVYRLRARDTGYRVARFNNSATQVTVLMLQNTSRDTVSGHVWFWSGGASAGAHAFTLDARASMALNTATVPGVAGASGAITLTHDGGYAALAGKAATVEFGTGFSFDTPLQPAPR